MAVGKPKGLPKSGGREKGVLNKNSNGIKELLDSRVDFNLIIDKLIELVVGVEVQTFNSNGQPVIYSKPPDSQAAKILLEYRFGKPTQSVDFGGNSFVLTVNSQSDTTKKILQGNE